MAADVDTTRPPHACQDAKDRTLESIAIASKTVTSDFAPSAAVEALISGASPEVSMTAKLELPNCGTSACHLFWASCGQHAIFLPDR